MLNVPSTKQRGSSAIACTISLLISVDSNFQCRASKLRSLSLIKKVTSSCFQSSVILSLWVLNREKRYGHSSLAEVIVYCLVCWDLCVGERIGWRLGSCIRRWSEMKRLTLRKIRGRCGEIVETALERKEKTRRECVDWGLDTVKLCYYQLGIGFYLLSWGKNS